MYSIIVAPISFLLYSIPYWIVQILIILLTLNIYKQDTTVPIFQTNYDYIIVGAGSAGTIIFSEMPANASILLIEAGSDHDLRLFDIPIIAPALQRTSFDWSYLTESQNHACHAMQDHKCRLAAGRGYGGSNILNNMIYHRGHEKDFQGWFNDANEYNYKDILDLFRELENDLLPAELIHRTDLYEIFKSLRFPSDVKFIPPRVLQRDGFRWSMAHLARSSQSPNHQLVTGAQAIKLHFTTVKKNHINSIEIKYKNQVFKLKANKGYILTAGAIETPKLLLHSGIGPCDELAKQFIPCNANLAGVGKNLQDHIATGLDLITLNTTLSLNLLATLNPKNIYTFLFKNGRSTWSTVGCEALGFHTPPEKLHEKPSLGFMVLPMGISSDAGVCLRKNLNIDDRIWNNYFRHLQANQVISIIPIVLQPKSRGYIKLVSKNAENPPAINPQYLSNPEDTDMLLEGIKIIEDILKNPELQAVGAQITKRPLQECESFESTTPEYWRCYIRYMSFSVFHLAGTCQLGDPKDPKTVVDRTTFLVKGIDNLYIADASVMPNLPSGNPNAAVALIAKHFMRVHLRKDSTRKMNKSIPPQADLNQHEHKLQENVKTEL